MKTHTIRVQDDDQPIARQDQFVWRLAEAARHAGPVEDDIAELVIDRLIDGVAVGVAGLTLDTPARARAQALAHPRASGATLLGLPPGYQVAAEWAAYANTTAVRQLDWSDTFGGVDFSHPSDCLGPMVAVAQQSARDGTDLIRGIAHGYEVMVSLTGSIPLHTHGIDQFANLGAAIPTGLVAMLNLPVEVGYQAIGLTAYLSALTYQVRTGNISAWKSNGPGFVGKTAIEAVDRALRDEDAPNPVYEGGSGELAVLLGGRDAAFDIPLLEPGESPRLMATSFPKQWPAEYLSQPFIDMALRLRRQIPDLRRVKDILLTGSADMQLVIGSSQPARYDPDAPRGTLDHSLMFIMAIALEDGTVEFDRSFAAERIHRPETITLWRKIRTQQDPYWTDAITAADPTQRKTGGTVDIALDDGTELHDSMDNANSYNIPTLWRRTDYVAKFHSVTERFLVDGEADRFLDLVQCLPDLRGDALLGLYPRIRDGVVADGGNGLF